MVIIALLLIIQGQAARDQCLTELSPILDTKSGFLLNLHSAPSTMATLSGHTMNDLGQYDKCNSLPDAKYTVFQLGIMGFFPQMHFALCGPKSCSEADYRALMNFTAITTFQGLSLSTREEDKAASGFVEIHFPKEYYDQHVASFDTPAIIMITVICVLCALALLGTVLELLGKFANRPVQNSEGTELRPLDEPLINEGQAAQHGLLAKMLICFSLYSNLQRLFLNRSTEKLGKPDTMGILEGMRVLSTMWIVLTHVTFQTMLYKVLSNLDELPAKSMEFDKTFAYAGFLACDTFFFLSGILLAFFLLNELNRKTVNWLLLYVHRVLRIMPLLAFVLFMYWTLQKYLGSGPMWYNAEYYMTGDCTNSWYTTLLFFNNFTPIFNPTKNCVIVSWYLANDMQFFIISPVILYFYHKYNKKLGWAAIVLLNLLTIVASLGIAYSDNLKQAILSTDNMTPEKATFVNDYYQKPYCRVGPYAIGLAVGMILYSYRHHKETNEVYDPISLAIVKLYHNNTMRYVLSLLGLFLVLFFVLFQYDTYSDSTGGTYNKWGDFWNIVFIAIHRVGFTLGVSLFTLPVLMGYFSFLAWFLGGSIWTPLARLNFTIFLIHYNIIFSSFRSQSTAEQLDDFLIFRDWLFYFCLAALVAVPIYLLVELPVLNLDNLLLRRRFTQQDKSKSS